MSKHALRETSRKNSGVSYEESQLAINLSPSIYERIGKEDGFRSLSQSFYDRVFADNGALWFVNIFANSTKEKAVEKQGCYTVLGKA